MDINLSLHETRIIGALLEKELTTPDQYPLSLNALTTACNQKSNRDPVLSLEESLVRQVLDELIKKRLVKEVSSSASRVVKFQHRFCNTEFSKLQLSAQELGIICCLFLRGPQTPGELRTRSNRLCTFENVDEVEKALGEMASREIPLVRKLPREPGKRESRYLHLLGEGKQDVVSSDDASLQDSDNAEEIAKTKSSQEHVTKEHIIKEHSSEAFAQLEARVSLLESEMIELKSMLEDLTS